MRSILRLTSAAALLLAAALPAAGQVVVPGFARINQSDITGPQVTTGDMLNWEPGTVQTLNCAAAWGLLDEGRKLTGEIDSLRLSAGDANLRTPSPAAQQLVARLLEGGPGALEAGEQVRQALVAGNPGAGLAASRLVDAARGLLGAVQRIDPLRPGRGAPTRLHESVGAWNDLVDASAPAFLAAPPDEFLALRAVIGRLDRAAIAHAARIGDPWQVDEFGAACAPVRQAPAVPPPPPLALDFAVCALSGAGFVQVEGVFLPETGDSLVTVNGERKPLRTVYPDTGYAVGQPWFARDTAITVLGRRYVQWGMSRVVQPGELRPYARYLGIPVFTEPNPGPRPDVVFIPFRPGCEVQPYRRVEEARRVRG